MDRKGLQPNNYKEVDGQRLEGIPVECRLAFRGGTVITALDQVI